jgi:hypothetical protein
MQKERSNPLFNVVSNNRTLDFNNTIRRLLSLCENRSLLSCVVEQLPKKFISSGMNVPADTMASILGTQLGLYSFLYQWMYSGTEHFPTIVRTDNLLIGLQSFFEHIQVNFTEEMRSYLFIGDIRNQSNHQHYSTYYDNDVMEMVNHRDNLVIESHKYDFNKSAG